MDEDMAKLLIKVPAADVDAVNAGLYGEFPSLGPTPITAEYSADGNAPATYYICSVYVTVANKDAIVAFLLSDFAGMYEYRFVSIDAAQSTITTDWGLYPVTVNGA